MLLQIPRRSSECIVQAARGIVRSKATAGTGTETGNRVSVLDLGTGSGCLLLSILHGLSSGDVTSCTCGVGVDLSESALNVARANACKLGKSDTVNGTCRTAFVNCAFQDVSATTLAASLGDASPSFLPFDVMVCNPPYLVERNGRAVCLRILSIPFY